MQNSTNSTLNTTDIIYTVDSADSVWVAICSLLVMIMTPALGFFYSGFVDNKTFVLVVAQCMLIFSTITVVWTLIGFSLSFSDSNSFFIGNLKLAALNNIDFSPNSYSPTIPALLFFFYQNKFAAITPALIIGSTVGKLSLFTNIIFCTAWSLVAYCPIAYWNWNNNGFLKKMGSIDFAGGNVVHVSSGFAGLAVAIACDILEKKLKLKKDNQITTKPSVLVIMLGTTLLWFGWFGFNGGSSLGANSQGILALINTNLSACTSLVTYSAIGYLVNKRPSAIDMCLGAVIGLVGITPGAGYVAVYAAGLIGAITAAFCYLVCYLKEKYKLFDDRLDVFGCHGIGGVIGAILTGFFSMKKYSGVNGLFYGSGIQAAYQLASIVTVAAWSFATSMAIIGLMYYTKLIYFGSSFQEKALLSDPNDIQENQKYSPIKKSSRVESSDNLKMPEVKDIKIEMTDKKITS